ncbi:MAG: LemA family protein [Bacteroidales bacterium]|nr:MAG: LemA family protein [Bacteroidales bacterium]
MKKWIVIGAIILVVIIIYSSISGSYNKMVQKDEAVKGQWGNVENVYQRRSDLIPNLVSTVKGYADFEQKTLTDVIEARSKATQVKISPENLNKESLQQFQSAQGELSSTLSRLMMVVEQYPNLKANQNFLDLQAQLEGTENRIAVERKRFNDLSQEYNTFIRQFPKNIWASMFGFEKKVYFEAEAGAEKAPKVSFDK